MASVITTIGTLGFLTFSLMLAQSFFRKSDTIIRNSILLGVAFLVLGLGNSLNGGWNDIILFLGAAGFFIALVFIAISIHSALRNNGEAKKYMLLAVIPIIVFVVSFAVADTGTDSKDASNNEAVEDTVSQQLN